VKVFLDSSVFGGYFDKEFAEITRQLFQYIKHNKIKICVSEGVIREINNAPKRVLDLLNEIPVDLLEIIPVSDKVKILRDAYILQHVLGIGSVQDAEHIATATVAQVDLIVSWNFRHIVNFQKIKGFNGVNLLMGYGMIQIYSPREVVSDEGKEEI
jgi:hypothetical protein